MTLRTPREPDQDYDGTAQVFGRLIPTGFIFYDMVMLLMS